MKTVDLFCGCGGLSLGLERAGFNVVLGMDFNEGAMSTYRKNLEHDAILSDLKDRDRTRALMRIYAPEVIAGGPPCQDYSSAGKRNEGGRASLTLEFADAVIYALPKVFIMENVEPAIRSETYRQANDLFRAAGYGLTQRVLDASLCGVPQKRKRLFVVGAIGYEDGWLNDVIEERLADQPMSVREYMGDEIDIEHYYRHPRSYKRRGVFSIDEPSATIRGVNREPSGTYTAHPGDVADPSHVSVRALTVNERSRVQTFPREFVWPEKLSKTALEQMIGNAVPVELGRFVGECVLQKLGLKKQPVKRERRKSQPKAVDEVVVAEDGSAELAAA
ncbi:DNA (cytosine-5-)-methyltransferase [Roseibium sp. RKSG952]|nr:DNA (cytosine-5-)-methyltransferase [Roseibium sp. RKSG952]